MFWRRPERAIGILMGTQICTCLILRFQAKYFPFKPCALELHKGDVVLGSQDAQSPAGVTLSQRHQASSSTWGPFPASPNDIPADPSSPLTAAPIWVSIFHLPIYQAGQWHGITVFTLYRSILFNPRDDAFSHELKIALPPPQ